VIIGLSEFKLLTKKEEGLVAGHSGQFTPGGYLSTVKHTALAGIEHHNLPIVSLTRHQ